MSNFLLSSRSHWIEQDAFSKKELSPKDLALIFKDFKSILHKYLSDKLPKGTKYSLHIKVFTHENFSQLHHIIVDLQIEQPVDLAATGTTVVPRPPTPPVPIGTKALFPLDGGYFQTLAIPVTIHQAP